MSRVAWWGEFFERLICIMKKRLTKKIGRALLQYRELENVLLDVECFMSNRLLYYVGEELFRPVLTLNILLLTSWLSGRRHRRNRVSSAYEKNELSKPVSSTAQKKIVR